MSDKMRNLITRTASGVVLLGVVLGAAYGGLYSYGVLLGVILFVGMWEFYRLATASGSEPQYVSGLVSGVTLFLTGFFYFVGLGSKVTPDWALIIGGIIYFVLLVPSVFII